MRKVIFACAIGIFFAACSQGKEEVKMVTETVTAVKAMKPADLIGKTIEYKYGESIYHVTIDGPENMHWQAMAGEETGTLEYENYKIESIDAQKLFITWGEANGVGVSQILDFENGVVHNHLLRGRDISIGKGEIRILE